MGFDQSHLDIGYGSLGLPCIVVRDLRPGVLWIHKKLCKWGSLLHEELGGCGHVFVQVAFNYSWLWTLEFLNFKGLQELLKFLHKFYSTAYYGGLVTLHQQTFHIKGYVQEIICWTNGI